MTFGKAANKVDINDDGVEFYALEPYAQHGRVNCGTLIRFMWISSKRVDSIVQLNVLILYV